MYTDGQVDTQSDRTPNLISSIVHFVHFGGDKNILRLSCRVAEILNA